MKIEESGIWVTDREAFAQGLRAFLRPVITRVLWEWGIALLLAGVVVGVMYPPAVAWVPGWIAGYVGGQVCRGLWWLYQPRWPWTKETSG